MGPFFNIDIDETILLHDNVCPHVTALVKNSLGNIEFVLPHPPYFPDIAPITCYDRWHFTSYKDTKNCVEDSRNRFSVLLNASRNVKK